MNGWAEFPFLLGTIVLPLLAAAIAALAGRYGHWCAWGMTPWIVASVGGLLCQIQQLGPQRYTLAGWQPPLGIALYGDGLSAAMLLMTAIVGLAVQAYAPRYFSPASARDNATPTPGDFFWPLWLFLWGALNALFLSGDLFNLYVTLELVTLASVALVALAVSHSALDAALRYLIAAFLGSLAYLMGVALLYGQYGVLDLQHLGQAASTGQAATLAGALICAGLLLKTALFPLHFWLPAAHSSAPAPVSALLSSLVVKASFYMIVRLWLTVFAGTFPVAALDVVGLLGAAAIIWGSLQALAAERLKLLIAHSTVAQLGYLFVGLSLLEFSHPQRIVVAIVLMALSHALAKGAFFLTAGAIQQAAGHDRIEELGSVAARLPASLFAIGLAGVALMGLPPSAAFMGKWMLLEAAIQRGRWLTVVILLVGGLLAAGYILRIVRLAFLPAESSATLRSLSAASQIVPMLLALLAVFAGLASGPLEDLIRVGLTPEANIPAEDTP